MFTGIISDIARVKKISEKNYNLVVRFDKPKKWKLKMGESVAISGICSTVLRSGSDWFEVEYMPETLKRTTVANFEDGTRVNLEQSLRFNDIVSGHFVQGHVDTRGTVKVVNRKSNSMEVQISMPKDFRKYVVFKGSITIDGVALTVSAVNRDGFSVSVMPFTMEHTTLGDLKKGLEINVETDMFAKYVYSFLTSTE